MLQVLLGLVYRFYERRLEAEVRSGNIPRHVGVLPDGNRRFARSSGLARVGDGHREGADVQVIGDVAAGDRVVTVGAPLIRLAALSPQAPAHGHTH